MASDNRRLLNILEELGDNLGEGELEVLIEVADGLLKGQRDYGCFDLANDQRDFRREGFEEDRDWLVYRAAEIVRNRKLSGV